MSAVQVVALAVVAIGGGAVALVSDPLRQTLLLGIYGVALTVLFFALQAPDVALSEIVVSTIGLPLIVLLALRKIREQERSKDEDGDG
jgi:energy-converting hydrogenase B subunit D